MRRFLLLAFAAAFICSCGGNADVARLPGKSSDIPQISVHSSVRISLIFKAVQDAIAVYRSDSGTLPRSHHPVPVDRLFRVSGVAKDDAGPLELLYVGSAQRYALFAVRGNRILYYWLQSEGYGEFAQNDAPLLTLPSEPVPVVEGAWVTVYENVVLNAKSRIRERQFTAEEANRMAIEQERLAEAARPRHLSAGLDRLKDRQIIKLVEAIDSAMKGQLVYSMGPFFKPPRARGTNLFADENEIRFHAEEISFLRVEKMESSERAKVAVENYHLKISAAFERKKEVAMGDKAILYSYPNNRQLAFAEGMYFVSITISGSDSATEHKTLQVASKIVRFLDSDEVINKCFPSP